MNLQHIVNLYKNSEQLKDIIKTLGEQPTPHFHLKGLIGSQLSFIIGAISQITGRFTLLVVSDREEAHYLVNDLEFILPEKKILLYPASNKRPYQIESIDNANVLMRSEALNMLIQSPPDELIYVTYPEALYEKVVTKKVLQTHTLQLHVGDKPGMSIVLELLEEYNYQKTHFVTEPGQYAVRGGIIDIFTFSHEFPYRIEFLGDEIEEIRVFEVGTQCSIRNVNQISIFPNLQTALIEEARISFLEFIPSNTLVFIDSIPQLLEQIDKMFGLAIKTYQELKHKSGGSTIRSQPEALFCNSQIIEKQLLGFPIFECNNLSFYPDAHAVVFESNHQPKFNKNFELITQHLIENQEKGIKNVINCENEKQQRRLKEIFLQINDKVVFQSIISSLHKGFLDTQLGIAIYTDHELFERYHRFRDKAHLHQKNIQTLKELTQLQPGDYVTHVTHGIGKFAGLVKIKVGENEQEAIKIIYQDGDEIYVNVNSLHKISKYVSKDGLPPKLSKLGSNEWSRTKAKIKKRVKELAFDLVKFYAQRKATKGFAFPPDCYLQHELEASFIYEDTPDQLKTTEEVKRDMEQSYPMDRLICGDVGFGKTEIAIRAAFKAAVSGKQVAVMVPTTVLALQHYNTFKERLQRFPVNLEYISRYRSKKEQNDILKRLAEGKIDILIGTHRLLSKDVVFKDLGLLIIDEEHKFGVAAKEKLRLMKTNVDTLTLTATPIPRTLQFSLLGIRDLSVISTPPPNRIPVETTVCTFRPEVIRDAIAYELRRGGQVFFVHNRIKDLDSYAALIKELVPESKIAITHGQQDGDLIEETLLRFIMREFNVLVCTTIIESGLDIPNANTIIINQAHTYGLSDLHQMRGRVGRSNRKAFCYLIAPPLIELTEEARKRLKAIEEFSDLGSGMQIAMRDLDIRGAGNIFGSEQSGFITEIGYDMYQKILDEAIQELKEEHLLETEETSSPLKGAKDCQIETDYEVNIPDTYIPNTAERLSYYKRISEINEEKELVEISKELIDRFGPIPAPALAFMDTIRIREQAKILGFEKIVMKNGVFKAYFISNPEDPFYQSGNFQALLDYLQQDNKFIKLKQVNNSLQIQIENIRSIKDAYLRIKQIANFILHTVNSSVQA
ncbi:MAG: transcription-repair coupling factor [Bacteroidia bacterium]|nr:transcription-repair coupling factor [Bacteroidia bacterium]MDW8158641.1 transcription-repair coupling factor [Bacteroidia bacterium]